MLLVGSFALNSDLFGVILFVSLACLLYKVKEKDKNMKCKGSERGIGKRSNDQNILYEKKCILNRNVFSEMCWTEIQIILTMETELKLLQNDHEFFSLPRKKICKVWSRGNNIIINFSWYLNIYYTSHMIMNKSKKNMINTLRS